MFAQLAFPLPRGRSGVCAERGEGAVQGAGEATSGGCRITFASVRALKGDHNLE